MTHMREPSPGVHSLMLPQSVEAALAMVFPYTTGGIWHIMAPSVYSHSKLQQSRLWTVRLDCRQLLHSHQEQRSGWLKALETVAFPQASVA